jgi:hypothetical protein
MANESLTAFKEEAAKASAAIKETMDKLVEAYEKADDEDRAQVHELVERGKRARRESAVYKLRPGAAAILFFDYNKQNREWRASVSEEYAEQIKLGEFEYHNQGIGFLDTGDLGDGQHRCAGVALADQGVELPVVFGMTVASIIAIDICHRRQASDFLGIGKQITEPKRKQQMVKQAFSTLRRLAGDDVEKARPYVLRSGNRDIVRAIEKHDQLLKDAIAIGDKSVEGLSHPTFKATEASSLAFLLLLKGWPKVKIAADLDTFQTGQDREGGSSPLFVAATQLQKDAQKKEGATFVARLAGAIQAFVLHEKGMKAIQVKAIRDAMKMKEVDPTYPGATIVPMREAN